MGDRPGSGLGGGNGPMIQRVSSVEEAKNREQVERGVHLALQKIKDDNSFYRSKGCRDLIDLDKKFPGYTHMGALEKDLWSVMAEMLVELATKDEDEDVRNFADKALHAIKAPFNPETRMWSFRQAGGDKQMLADKAKKGGVSVSINDSLMDGEPVYRQYNAWRTALLRSLRENRTVSGIGNMELIALRANGTRMNRVVNFRGFLPDKKGEPGDRLYYVTDSNVEKAEQVARDAQVSEIAPRCCCMYASSCMCAPYAIRMGLDLDSGAQY